MKTSLKIVLIILIIFPNIVFGAPSISGVNGIIADGQSVTISGNGFGIKTPAAPILWENFDSGSNGQAIGGWNGWVAYGGVGGTLSDISPYSGILSAHNRVTGPYATDPVTDTGFNTSNYFFDPTDEIYYSYMAKFTSTGDSYGVDKWGRSNCAPNLYNGSGDITIQYGQVTFNTGSIVYTDSHVDDSGLSKWVQTRFTDWTRHEIYKKLSTPGIADGIAQFRMGTTVRTYSNAVTREFGYSFQQSNIILGLMFANARNDGDISMYIDDVYVDKTLSRVEICGSDTWSNRDECDIQIPSSWSTTSNTITINQGSFSDGDTAYLYVIDENGGVNEAGYPITFSSSEDDAIAPSSPIGLGVI